MADGVDGVEMSEQQACRHSLAIMPFFTGHWNDDGAFEAGWGLKQLQGSVAVLCEVWHKLVSPDIQAGGRHTMRTVTEVVVGGGGSVFWV